MIISSWTENPERYWFRRCDMCKRRRPFQWLHECYAADLAVGWWFACLDCTSEHQRRIAELSEEA